MPDPKNPSAPPGEGGSDLPSETMQRIDAMHDRLTTIDHFTLLGLSRSATKAQVRQAFLALAPQFHPDKYFGRSLGAYAAKMQRVFMELSAAHDILVNDERRAEYTRGLAPASAPPPRAPGVPAVAAEEKGKSASPVDFTDAAPAPARSPSEMPAEVARARQQAFAAKLAGHAASRLRSGTPVTAFPPPGSPARSFRPPEALRGTPATATPGVNPKAAVEALKRRYEESVAQARGKQSQGLLQAADAAKVKVEEHSAAMEMAKAAEQKQDYADAANRWARAFDLVPAAETAHRASLCFRRAGSDGRRAAKYGEEAVKLDPNKASYRVNLALVYADLGLVLRARGEIERAHALEPQSSQVKEALARIKTMK